MKIRIKLSMRQDMDFIALQQCSSFPLVEWIKISLAYYVKEKKTISIPLPTFPQYIVEQKQLINFSLHPIKDKEVIEWLKSIRNGQRTSAIKCIFRSSLEEPCLYAHKSSSYICASSIEKKGERTNPVVNSHIRKIPSMDEHDESKRSPQQEKKPLSQKFDIFDISFDE